MMEKKSLKYWWSERSKNQKYLIIGGIMFIAILASRKNNNNYAEENTNSNYTPKIESNLCSFCGKSYTGSGYNDDLGLGRSYCSGYCYVDAN